MDDPVLNGFFIFLNGKTGLKWMLKWLLGGTDVRNSRATTNVEFENVLGPHGLEFDRTFRVLVPWFVHYDSSRSPIEII